MCAYRMTITASHPTPPHTDVYAQCVLRVSEPVFAKITGLQSVQGIGAAAEVDLPHDAQLSSMAKGTLRRLLVLDGVQDPGNLGTLLRTALALGWQAVYLLEGCCDPFNDKAVRASRGASFRIPLTHGDWDGLQALVDRHDMVAVAAQPRAEVVGVRGMGWYGLLYTTCQLRHMHTCTPS